MHHAPPQSAEGSPQAAASLWTLIVRHLVQISQHTLRIITLDNKSRQWSLILMALVAVRTVGEKHQIYCDEMTDTRCFSTYGASTKPHSIDMISEAIGGCILL